MEDAGDEILKQATGKDRASSEDVVDASESVFNGGANIIKSASQNDEEVRRKGEQLSTARKSPIKQSN